MDVVKQYSLYALCEPDTQNKFRYIGISYDAQNRYKQHLFDKVNIHKYYWIKKHRENGLSPNLVILESGLTPEQAFDKEIMYIDFFKSEGYDLINMTKGGTAPMLGKKHTEESKKKRSIMFSGEGNPFYGKKHSDDVLDRIRVKNIGRKSWNKGGTLSDEHRKKLSDVKKSKFNTGEIAIWNKGKSKIDVNLVFRLREEGKTHNEISSIIGCAQSNVSRILNNKYFNRNKK